MGISSIAPKPPGAIRRPASSADLPRTAWKYKGTNSIVPNTEIANRKNDSPAYPARVCVKVRMSISGLEARQLCTNHAAISSTPTAVGPHERSEPKPYEDDSARP